MSDVSILEVKNKPLGFQPIGKKIIIQIKEVDSMSAGGIIIPDKAKDVPTLGVIVAVNDEVKKEYGVDVGTEILFGRHTTVSVKINGQSLNIMEIDKAHGVFK